MSEINEKEIERRFENISKFELNPEVAARDLEQARETLIEQMNRQQPREPKIWRIIMKSPITKLAAAAVIIIVIVLSITILDKLITPAYAVTDLPGLFEQAKVIHIKGWHYFPEHTMPDGKEIPPVAIDNWMDLENGRSRCMGTGLGIDKNGVRVTVSETISDDQHKMCLNHTEKYAMFFKVSEYQRMLDAYQLSKLMFGQIFGEIEQLQNFKKTGREKIENTEYDVWQGEMKHAVVDNTYRLKFWLSPESGKLGRLQMWTKLDKGQWGMGYEFSTVDYNVAVPDATFAMEIPKGYTLKNTVETAVPLELGGGAGVGYGSLWADTRIGFMMSDDSVIVGWHSVDDSSEIPQDALFRELEVGGALPKLPVEIYGLKPAGITSDITYIGYHLGYTKKAAKFIEWALYIPNSTPPVNVKQLGCDVLYRFNLDPEPKWKIGLTVDCSLLIDSANEFDKWVLGAMAELSDDGKAPEYVIYENVLRLVEQIRSGLK